MSDSRARVWFSLFVLAVFCVGLAVGLLLGRRMDVPRGDGGMFVGPPGARGGPAGRGGRGILIERLARELELSPEQKTRVRAILDARRPRVEAFQRDIAARAEQEQRDLQTEVRGVLTAEQQQRFDRWVERQPRGRRARPPM